MKKQQTETIINELLKQPVEEGIDSAYAPLLKQLVHIADDDIDGLVKALAQTWAAYSKDPQKSVHASLLTATANKIASTFRINPKLTDYETYVRNR